MERRSFIGAALAAACTTATGRVAAQGGFPSGPVRIIVPFPPGGGTDTLSRRLAQHLAESVPGSFVVENVGGAGGSLGAAQVARARPDGHTLMMSTAGISAINQSLYRSLPYDPEREFIPVSRVASTVFALVAHPGLGVASVKELIDLSRSGSGQLYYASAGIGAAGHLPAELFKSMTGTRMEHVPYRGTGPALTDLIGGQTSIKFAILGAALPHIRSGALKVLATTGETRSEALPDVPTVAEAGVPGYSADEWWGIVVPAGTPPEIVSRINGWIRAYVADPETRARLVADGFEPASDDPEGFAALIDRDRAKWGRVIREAGVRLD
jgi:tripartite-type tricarboxylate transporter receptor subunit TctC